MGLGLRQAGFQAQKNMLETAGKFVEVHTLEAKVTSNCTMVSVIASHFIGIPGVMARILATLARIGVPVYQTADSEYSISVLIPEADIQKATRALHDEFKLGVAPSGEAVSAAAVA